MTDIKDGKLSYSYRVVRHATPPAPVKPVKVDIYKELKDELDLSLAEGFKPDTTVGVTTGFPVVAPDEKQLGQAFGRVKSSVCSWRRDRSTREELFVDVSFQRAGITTDGEGTEFSDVLFATLVKLPGFTQENFEKKMAERAEKAKKQPIAK